MVKMKHIRMLLAVSAVAVTSFACASAPQLTAEETAWLKKAMDFPTSFSVPRAEADAAWTRAQSFVARYSTMPLDERWIQTSAGTVIATLTPISMGQYGYLVTRAPLNDTLEGFTGECTWNKQLLFGDGARADQNSHLLAYFMVTGEENPRCVYR
jgi:hypothetical protein